MKLSYGGRRRPAVKRRLVLCTILVVAASVGLPVPARACGTGTHHEIVDRAIEKLRIENTYPELIRLLGNNPGAVYAGSVFPDWPYGEAWLQDELLKIPNSFREVAEDTHTDRFMQGYLQYLLANGICPPSDDGTKLDCETADDEWTLAFLFGLVSHHEADSAWHPDDASKHTHPLLEHGRNRFETEAAAQENVDTTTAEVKAERWVNIDHGQTAKTTFIPLVWAYPRQEALEYAYRTIGWQWSDLAAIGVWEGMNLLAVAHSEQEVEAGATWLSEEACRWFGVDCREMRWTRLSLVSYDLGGLNDCADKTVASWKQYWDRLTGHQEMASVKISGPTEVGPGQYSFTAELEREYASPPVGWAWDNGDSTMTTMRELTEDGTVTLRVETRDMWGDELATASHTVTVKSWEGWVRDNKSGSTPTLRVESAIAVVVTDRPGLVVDIHSGGWTATCTTGNKAEYGPNACEFGGLRASTYTIAPRDLGVSVQVTVDGVGWALVQFDPVK